MIQLFSVFVIGVGIGWLSGLSISPVIGTVLASLVGVAGGIVAGVRSIARTQGESRIAAPYSVDARLAALLVFGISFGAPMGILGRTYRILEPNISAEVDRRQQGVLFGISVETCDKLRSLARYENDRAFRDSLAGVEKWGRLVEQGIAETAKLKTIVEDLCAQRQG